MPRFPHCPLFLAFLFACCGTAIAIDPAPFVESDFPFFQSQVELVPSPEGEPFGGNFVVRGIVLPLSTGATVLFDQELMRVGAIWWTPPDAPPIKLMGMAQISYANPKRKAGPVHPSPAAAPMVISEMHPGVAQDMASLRVDPRTAYPHDAGRGPLPARFARFMGIELVGGSAVLHYRSGGVSIHEWFDSHNSDGAQSVSRHITVEPSTTELTFNLGKPPEREWSLTNEAMASAAETAPSSRIIEVRSNSPAFVLSLLEGGELIATLRPSKVRQNVTLAISTRTGDTVLAPMPPTPESPPPSRSGKRWPQFATSSVELSALNQSGLVLDRIATPDDNPWRRRVRAADLTFVTTDRAAVVTFDGDVWLVEGLADENLSRVVWRRFASGLQEPLSIVKVGDVLQVATKNGVVRLHDRDGDGEADWYENFSDQYIQSQTTRSFPLDMALGRDGSTYVTQGGIVDRSGLKSGGEGTPHSGSFVKISADGAEAEVFASAAREPFLTVHPETDIITATDQQGHYVPSSVVYLVRKGDNFGFPVAQPAKLTPPLVWIPHELDISSSSQVWVHGAGMGKWNGKLLHLSYGNGRLFIITPDLGAPIPQGTAIPIDLKTELPLLHGRMHPDGNAVYFAGFSIWGTRTTINWALGRLRTGDTPIRAALGAKSVSQGAIVDFGAEIAPESLTPDRVQIRAWNYKRSSDYGSGRYALDGTPGTTPLNAAQLVRSHNGASVFVHIPDLPVAMQIEIRYDLRAVDGSPVRGTVYLTVHSPAKVELASVGFAKVDLTKKAVVSPVTKLPPPSGSQGKAFAETFGCLACHSTDGTVEGKVGPTWKGLFGSRRTFVDGRSEIADESYLLEKILDPNGKRLKKDAVEMPSYRGVLDPRQLDSIVMYIKSLR